MLRARVRKGASLVSVIALVGLLAACAHKEEAPPPAAPPPPPPAAEPAPPPPPPAAEMPGLTVTAKVRVHAAPTTRSKIVASLNRGDQVQATGKKTRGWTQVTTPGGEGWVISRYLKPS